MRQPKERFALCLDNADYEVSLIPGKVYLIIPDERRHGHSVTSKTMKIDAQASHAGRYFRTRAQQDGLIRIVDESGEDYLYHRDLFAVVEFPESVEVKLLAMEKLRRTA